MTSPHPAPHGALDLQGREAEPIRIPGAIQPHGVLVGLGGPGRATMVASANPQVICRRIIDRHRGAMVAKSIPGPESIP